MSMEFIVKRYYRESPFKFYEEFAEYHDSNGYFDAGQGKNQNYKILLDFYEEKIGEDIELFRDILKYDYVSLGKTSNVPDFFVRNYPEDFKNRCHVFLQDDENVKKYIPKHFDTPAKMIIKYVQFEPFRYDVEALKENIMINPEKIDNIVMFDYDISKIFEKSLSYRVEI